MGILDVIISATDNASAVVDSISQNTANATDKMNVNWGAVGVGIGAVGLAMEGLAQSQQELTNGVDKLSASTGLSSEAVRGLAMDLSDVNMPLEDSVALLDMASKSGLEGEEAIMAFSGAVVNVAKVTGENAQEVGKWSQSLKSIGVDLSDTASYVDALGYITTKTNVDFEEFTVLTSEFGPKLQNMGVGINETAAIMGIMNERGMDTATMSMNFSTAVDNSEGSLSNMLNSLGITATELETYKGEVVGSGAALEEQALKIDENVTSIQKMKQGMEELAFKYGDQIGVMGDFSAVLTGVGSAMTIYTGVKAALTATTGLATIATSAFGIAVAIATSPITLIVLGIAALIAVGVLLYKNWDTVSEVGRKVFGGIGDFFVSVFDSIEDKATGFSEVIKGIFFALTAPMLMPLRLNIMVINGILDFVNKIKFKMPDWIPESLGGGKTIDFNIPKIPKFHTGGTFKALTAGGEGLAMLEDGERVVDRDFTGNNNQNGGYKSLNLIVQLDGKVLTQANGVNMVDEILIRTR